MQGIAGPDIIAMLILPGRIRLCKLVGAQNKCMLRLPLINERSTSCEVRVGFYRRFYTTNPTTVIMIS